MLQSEDLHTYQDNIKRVTPPQDSLFRRVRNTFETLPLVLEIRVKRRADEAMRRKAELNSILVVNAMNKLYGPKIVR